MTRHRNAVPVAAVSEPVLESTARPLGPRLRNRGARLKEVIRQDIQSIPGLMALLMKPRNGGCWTVAERTELIHRLRGLSRVGLFAALTVIPGGVLALPLLAWWLDRRQTSEARVARRRAGD